MNYTDKYDPLEPFVNPEALRIANQQHDEELARIGISLIGRVRAGWDQVKMVRRGFLNDKKIRAYEKAGYYSPEFKEARRKLMQRNVARIKMTRAFDTFPERNGNFIERDGRLIYSP